MKRNFIFCITFFLLFCCYTPSGSAKQGVVKGSYINIRKDGDFNSPVIGKKLRGDKYKIIFEENGWFKVSFKDGTEGWIFGSILEKKGVIASGESESATDTSELPLDVPSLPTAIASPTTDKTNIGDKIKQLKEKRSKKSEEIGRAKDKDVASASIDGNKKGEQGSKTQSDTQTGIPDDDGKQPDKSPATLMSSSSKTAEDYYNEAIELYEKKKFPDALEANRLALMQAPRNSEILNNMGNCLFKMNKINEAIAKWKEALAISPKSAKICNNLGIAYYQSDENDKAVEFYKKAILFEPQFPDSYYNIASVYGYLGKFEDAMENYRKFLEFSPDSTMKQLTDERLEYCKKQMTSSKKKSAEKEKGNRKK